MKTYGIPENMKPGTVVAAKLSVIKKEDGQYYLTDTSDTMSSQIVYNETATHWDIQAYLDWQRNKWNDYLGYWNDIEEYSEAMHKMVESGDWYENEYVYFVMGEGVVESPAESKT